MLVLKILYVFIEPFNFSFFSITGWGIGLDYCDIEWSGLYMNRDHSVVFEIASKYCISDSFVDHDGYSISSKEFLPAVVAIMVISVKFTYSGGSDVKASAHNMGDLGSIPVSGRSPGEGNGNPFQYSCLESPMDERTL